MENLPPPKEITVRPVTAETRVAGYPGYGPGYGEGYPPTPQQETEGGGLLAYWLSIRRHKGMVLLFAMFGVIGGVLMTLRQTPVYQARTSIEILDINLDFLGGRPVQPVGDDSNYAALVDIPTQVRLLQSDSLRVRVMDKLAAGGAVTKMAPNFLSTWKAALKIGPPAQDQTINARNALMGCRVISSTTTRIIDLVCDSSSPAFAASYANTLATEFIDSNVEARWKMSQRTGEWLTKQLEDLRVKLERSEDNLQNYAKRANLNFTGEKTNVSEERLSQLQTSLSEAQSSRVAAQSRFEIIRSSPTDALGAIADDDSLRKLEDGLADLRRTEAELLATYTPRHEKVVKVQAQIAPLQAALQKQRTVTMARAQKEFEGAQNKENLLNAEYQKQSQLVSGESERAIQYGILKREVDSNRQLYDSMLQKVKETSVTSAMRASNIRVVDSAKVPVTPYKPDIAQNIEIGMFAGLLLGISFVLMRERADHTIQQPGDAPFWLGVPELGIIPKAKMGLSWRLSYGGGASRPALASAAVPAETSDSRVSLRTEGKIVELVTWQSKPSVIAEAFRAVLVSILFANQEKKRPRVLVVTSSGPAEGKSTVVTNLGIAVAEVNQRVLLVDADLRKPRLHSILGVSNDRGLSDLLRSREPVEIAMEGLIQETGIPGLYLLPSGPSTSAAASLLYSNRMPEILRALRTQFDTVFIDTPPMLQIPDARVVGRMVDRVVIVVRAGKTTRDAAMAARQRFAEDGTPVLGTILNDWNPKWSPSGYYGYDGGYYSGYYEHKNGYSRGPLADNHSEAEDSVRR
ncbi:MAG: polysaccharide biosynthesis tyrosine autokinase [Bryobacteraceae bacterium]